MVISKRATAVALVLLGSCAIAQAITATTGQPKLIPIPREYTPRDPLTLTHGVSVMSGADPEDRFAAQDLSAFFEKLNLRKSHGTAVIQLLRAPSRPASRLLALFHLTIDEPMQQEGYVILPTKKGLAVIATTATGLFYGAQTVKQLTTGQGPTALLHTAIIRDWPAMRYRGISDDLSRGPFPTLDFQKRQIQTFAAYKLNIYSPYFENTLQYQSNPLAGLPGGSLSREDARQLVDFARAYHVTIVPEQEAFGHLHRMLEYEQYAPLAETPLGSVLAPGQPGSLQLISQLFSEIASTFPSPFLHIGADETADLGKGQTHADVAARGLGAVYVDFLIQIHDKLASLHRRLLFWGDIAMNSPEQVTRLPKDMIAIAWTYNPSSEGYASWLKPYTDAGMETWVAPGVSNWKRVYPDYDAGLRNIQGFVRDGQAAHSTGMLNTVWNDDGEGLFQEDWYGVLFGAAAAWQPGTTDLAQFGDAYGNVFHRDQTGKINEAQRELIAIDQMLQQAKVKDLTDDLFWMDPWSTEGQAAASELRPLLTPLRLQAERAITLLAQARSNSTIEQTEALDAMELGARRLDFIGQKFETADVIAGLYRQAYAWQQDPQNAKRINGLLYNISGTDGLCEDMRNRYSYIRLKYGQLWLSENRPYWLQNVLVRYDIATQLWVLRSAKFAAARTQWQQHHTLPPPAELGLP